MTGAGMERFTLLNGLRVLLVPEGTGGVVGVAVHYRVGFRSEPPGHAGLAHLMEHLMFRRQLPAGAADPVELAGGMRNAATGGDATDFHQAGPRGALETMLAAEADRMRGPLITAESLRREVGVVAEEIRRNITGRPYGGFPKFTLPPLLYRSFANTHDGYGEAARLGDIAPEQCAAFFTRHYAPGNALLTVAGAFEPGVARRLITRHFGPLPGRPVPGPVDLSEPEATADTRGEHRDPLAPLPAVCVGHRLPDPAGDLPGHLAHVLLAAVLEQRLRRRLVLREGAAVAVTAGCGLIGGPFAARHPLPFTCTVTHPPGTGTARVTAAYEAELRGLADPGPHADELTVAANRLLGGLLRRHDSLPARLRSLGTMELLHGDAALHHRIPGLLSATTPAATARAARRLLTGHRAVLTLVPGGAVPRPHTSAREAAG